MYEQFQSKPIQNDKSNCDREKGGNQKTKITSRMAETTPRKIGI